MQPSKCSEFRDLLSPFVDGELAAGQREAVRAHLDVCPACRTETQQLSQVQVRLRSAVNSQPAALGLETRIRARLREPEPRSWWGRPAFATSLAALALVTVTAGGWLTVLRPMNQQIAGILAIGRGDHVHCALERKSVGSFNRPLPKHHSEILPVAQASLPGYQLLESHLCRFRGRQFTHIVFGKQDKRLSIIMTAKQQGESFPKSTLLAKMRASGIPVYQNVSDGLRTAALETHDSWAYVVSDLDEQSNLQVMAKLGEILPVADRQ